MIETFIATVTSNLSTLFDVVFAIIAVASSIAAVTKTPADDEWVGKVYKIIDVLALNVGHAKDKAKKRGGRFVAN